MYKPIVSIIVAMDEKRGIGKKNKIPWHLRDDLIKLKKLTLGHVVILGRKTYESMVWYYNRSGRPMPGKMYIIITKDPLYKPERDHSIVVTSVEEALKRAGEIEQEESFIIGGEQIFKEALEKDWVDRLYITIVKGDYGADTFFPDYSAFKKVLHKQTGTSEGHDYLFIDLEK